MKFLKKQKCRDKADQWLSEARGRMGIHCKWELIRTLYGVIEML